MDINGFLDSMVRNVRIAVRVLAKTPGFTITVILTLALGIGANSAVFSAIDAVLLRPLPFPNGNQLVRMSQSVPGNPDTVVAPVRLEEWNRLNKTFDGITGYYPEDISETSGELPERLRRVWVARRFLQVLGVPPQMGAGFHSTRRALWRSECRSDQLPFLAAPNLTPCFVRADSRGVGECRTLWNAELSRECAPA